MINLSVDPPQPVGPAARHQLLDVLRGFALLGILVVNMALFSWPAQKVFLAQQDWATEWDLVVDWIVRIFAEGKFYPLFAFLFGYGMALQMVRAEQQSIRFVRLFSRRLFVLLLMGFVHAFLIWEGDILLVYAVFGFVLIPFRRCKRMVLLLWAVFLFQIPIAIYLLIGGVMAGGALIPDIANAIQDEIASVSLLYDSETDENLRIFATGTFAEIVTQRARNVMFFWQYAWVYAPVFVGMFLLGLYAARHRLLQELNPSFLRRALLLGLVIGVPLNVLYAVAFAWGDPMGVDWLWVSGATALTVGGPALTFAYTSAIALLLRGRDAGRIVGALAATGRMALSNYLFQSLVCTTIFYSYGLGLYGCVGRAAGVGLALCIYVLQLLLSVWWLQRFRFGPAEWLWRSLTYGQKQPMRLARAT